MADRLDIILVEKGIAKSREKAKALIKDGKVYINNIMQTKASVLTDEDAEIEVRGEIQKYVSRGGYKLEKAISEFALDLSGKVCMDIGASTGGFTDCMLQNGADFVYALDVGHDQLDEALARDERVLSLEGVNFRYFAKDDFDKYTELAGISKSKKKVLFIGCDVSFISLKYILNNAYDILENNGQMVCLIKPQFEAGREHLNKKGVCKDQKIHVKVIREVIDYAEGIGFSINNLSYSPITGPEGNIEYLLHITKESGEKATRVNASNTVNDAFSALK